MSKSSKSQILWMFVLNRELNVKKIYFFLVKTTCMFRTQPVGRYRGTIQFNPPSINILSVTDFTMDVCMSVELVVMYHVIVFLSLRTFPTCTTAANLMTIMPKMKLKIKKTEMKKDFLLFRNQAGHRRSMSRRRSPSLSTGMSSSWRRKTGRTCLSSTWAAGRSASHTSLAWQVNHFAHNTALNIPVATMMP